MRQDQQRNTTHRDTAANPGQTIGEKRTTEDVRPGQEGHLEVVEEQMEVGKREVEKGGVRVKRTVEEKPVEEKVNLREEHVRVERRPVDRPATAADANAFRETTVEVTERAEQPVVSKTARVIEEVIVGKEITNRTETVRDTVRRSDVEVDTLPGSNAPVSGTTRATGVARFEEFDNDFQTNYRSAPFAKEYTYDQVRPVYRYGYDLASDPSFRGRDWSAIETDARSRWETRNPGTWERFKDSVRHAWERAKAKMS